MSWVGAGGRREHDAAGVPRPVAGGGVGGALREGALGAPRAVRLLLLQHHPRIREHQAGGRQRRVPPPRALVILNKQTTTSPSLSFLPFPLPPFLNYSHFNTLSAADVYIHKISIPLLL
jgi:hypothetical protein